MQSWEAHASGDSRLRYSRISTRLYSLHREISVDIMRIQRDWREWERCIGGLVNVLIHMHTDCQYIMMWQQHPQQCMIGLLLLMFVVVLQIDQHWCEPRHSADISHCSIHPFISFVCLGYGLVVLFSHLLYIVYSHTYCSPTTMSSINRINVLSPNK